MKLGPFWRKRYSMLLKLVKRLTGLLDYIIWLALDPAKFKKINNKKIKKVLITLMHVDEINFGTDSLILGITSYLKKLRPNVAFTFILDKNTKNLFGKIPGISFWEYDRNKRNQVLQRIKKEKFDAVLLFDRDTYEITDFLEIPYRIYYTDTNPRLVLSLKNKFFITRKIYYPWGLHMVEFIFKMFEALGFKFERKDFIFHSNSADEKRVVSFLRKNKVKDFIVLHPGGKGVVEALKNKKWPPHLWPLDRYADVADHFRKKGFSVLVTGSTNESELAEEINKKSKYGVVNCCGKLTPREVGVLLKKTKLLISTDTGIVHIAYQVNSPILELFGPSDYTIAGAWPLDKETHKFLLDDGPCALSNRKKECPEGIICLERITVKEVIKEAEELIAMNPQ